MMNLKKKQSLDFILGTFLIVLLRLPVTILGKLLKRNHLPVVQGDILFIKMQGGGSLALAFPAICSIRKRYKDQRLLLLTSPSVAQFGESLGVFDEIICINDKNIISLIGSGLLSWWRCLRLDTVVDLEVYSRLSTVFSVLTAARNRVGFYLESVFWRKKIHTHLIFFNRFAGVYHFYEQVAELLDAPLLPFQECEELFKKRLVCVEKKKDTKRITIGYACSEMGTERMLTPAQWLIVFQKKKVTSEEFIFLGSKAERSKAQEITGMLAPHFGEASFINLCGSLPLLESISYLNSSEEFWGVDSSLLHYARLLGKKTVSFWGPTDPMTRLKNFPDITTEVYYRKVFCSPCIHVAESPPCNGKNICIEGLFSQTGIVVEEIKTLHSIV